MLFPLESYEHCIDSVETPNTFALYDKLEAFERTSKIIMNWKVNFTGVSMHNVR